MTTQKIWVVRDTDITVELQPYHGYNDEVRHYAAIVKQIKRHIDDVAAVYVVEHLVCFNCGYEKAAAVDTDGKTPMCCEAAQEAYAAIAAESEAKVTAERDALLLLLQEARPHVVLMVPKLKALRPQAEALLSRIEAALATKDGASRCPGCNSGEVSHDPDCPKKMGSLNE